MDTWNRKHTIFQTQNQHHVKSNLDEVHALNNVKLSMRLPYLHIYQVRSKLNQGEKCLINIIYHAAIFF